jgi:hypothetical protein
MDRIAATRPRRAKPGSIECPKVAVTTRSRYALLMTVTVTLDLPSDADAESPAELVRRLQLLWALDEVPQGRLTRLRVSAMDGRRSRAGPACSYTNNPTAALAGGRLERASGRVPLGHAGRSFRPASPLQMS